MRELKIDWAALHSAFQSSMPEVRCFLSLEDGQVLKMLPGDPKLAAVRCQPSRFVGVETVPSRIQYQWLDEFIASVEDEGLRARFQAAANGKGAFRRFKDILLTMPEERRRWFEFRDQRMRDRIVDWVREQGIMPLNAPPWMDEEEGGLPIPGNDPSDLVALRSVLNEFAHSSGGKWLAEGTLDDLISEVNKRFRVRTVSAPGTDAAPNASGPADAQDPAQSETDSRHAG